MKDTYKGKKKEKYSLVFISLWVRLIVISGPFTSFMMHTNFRRPKLMEKNALDFPCMFKEMLDFPLEYKFYSIEESSLFYFFNLSLAQ